MSKDKKTTLIDMGKQLKMSEDDIKILEELILKDQKEKEAREFIKKYVEQQERRKEFFLKPEKDQAALFEKMQKSKAPPVDMTQEKNLTPIKDIIKQADPTSPSDIGMVEKLKRLERKESGLTRKNLPDMPDFLKKAELPKAHAKFGKLLNVLGKTTKIGKRALPLLGLASDVLASDDLGNATISKEELERLKLEKKMTPKEREIKKLLEENLQKPSNVKDLADDLLKTKSLNPEESGEERENKFKNIPKERVEALTGVKIKEGIGQLPEVRKGLDVKRLSRSNRFPKMYNYLSQEKSSGKK